MIIIGGVILANSAEEIEARFIDSLTNVGNKLKELSNIDPDIVFTNTLSIP